MAGRTHIAGSEFEQVDRTFQHLVHELAGPVRETYLSDPARVPAPELVTRLSVPVERPEDR